MPTDSKDPGIRVSRSCSWQQKINIAFTDQNRQNTNKNKKGSKSEQLKIAFDGDAVIFSDESEKVFQEKGLKAFIENEVSSKTALKEEPFKSFLFAKRIAFASAWGLPLIDVFESDKILLFLTITQPTEGFSLVKPSCCLAKFKANFR